MVATHPKSTTWPTALQASMKQWRAAAREGKDLAAQAALAAKKKLQASTAKLTARYKKQLEASQQALHGARLSIESQQKAVRALGSGRVLPKGLLKIASKLKALKVVA